MKNNLEEIILQAIDIIATKKIASAEYDKTILGTVMSCQDEKLGKYKIKYQDSYWYAYSNNINISYSDGASVYVLIPKGDMRADKTILGGVKQLGVNYKNIAGGKSSEDQEQLILNGKEVYVLNGQNLIQNTTIWSLCSYKPETKVLYSKDVPQSENLLSIDKAIAKEYISNSNALAVSMDVQTELDPQQRYKGNYGILIGLDFKDNSTGQIVTRYYGMDIDNMTGNPYYYPNIINQFETFDIDGANFEQINFISLFVKDFPNQDETKLDDIFISNLQIGGASVLSESDLLSYSLSIVTPKGYIFNKSSVSTEQRTMQAQLRSKGRIVQFDPEDISLYWFVENTTVTTKHEKYSKYGGQGWECLNEYGMLQDKIIDVDGNLVSPAVYGFLPAQTDSYSVVKSDILAKSVKFKAVVVYQGNILSKEISILRHDSAYDIYVVSDTGTKFYYDSGSPTLTCYCKRKEGDTYVDENINNLNFVWSSISNKGIFSSLENMASAEQNKNKLILIKNNILKQIELKYIKLSDIVDVNKIFLSAIDISEAQEEDTDEEQSEEDIEQQRLKKELQKIRQSFLQNDINSQEDITQLFEQYDIETGNVITYDLLLNGDVNHERTITKAINSYSGTQRVVKNQIIDLSVRSITKFTTFKCSVFTKIGNQFLGTGSITISNSLSVENDYTLVINNGNQLFKYNTHGISPASSRLTLPQQIPLLSFSVYDAEGNKIDDDVISKSDITWTVPVEDTMLKANGSYEGGIISADLQDMSYKNLMTFGYTIAESYNVRKTRNNIALKIVYNGMTLTASTNLIFTKEGEEGTNGTEFICKIVPNADSGDIPVYPTIFYNGSKVSFNWDQDEDKPWFKVQLWHNDFEPIYVGTSSGTSTEDKLVTVEKWEVLRNVYKKSSEPESIVQDDTNLKVTQNESNEEWVFEFEPGILKNSWNSDEYRNWRPANILKVTVNYDGNIYYGTLPVIISRLFDSNYYKSVLKDYTGFQYVLYSAAGVDPTYDSHAPFEITTEFFIDGKWIDVSESDRVICDFEYSGSVWYKEKQENKTYKWVEQVETTNSANGESSKRWLKKRFVGADALSINQKAIQPVERYNGECVNTALVCIVSRATDGKVLAWLHMPIHFSFNRFANSAINGWDGNSVDLGADNGGTILAPQAGMGYKDQNNKFTGVILGTAKDPDAENTVGTGSAANQEAGLFAYHEGVKTAFIDAKTGKSTFGQEGQAQIILDPTQTNSDGRKVAQIKSGNYDQSLKTGLLIDLSTPEIKYGSGDFHVDKDGKLYAKGAYIDGQLSVNTVFGSQEDSPTVGQTLSKINSLGNEILLQVSKTYATKEYVSQIQVTPEQIRLQTTALTWKANNSELKEDGTLTCYNIDNKNIKTEIKGGKITSFGQLTIYKVKSSVDGSVTPLSTRSLSITYEDSIIGFYYNNRPRGAIAQVPINVSTTKGVQKIDILDNSESWDFLPKQKDFSGLVITSVGNFEIDITNSTIGSTETARIRAYKAVNTSNVITHNFYGNVTLDLDYNSARTLTLTSNHSIKSSNMTLNIYGNYSFSNQLSVSTLKLGTIASGATITGVLNCTYGNDTTNQSAYAITAPRAKFSKYLYTEDFNANKATLSNTAINLPSKGNVRPLYMVGWWGSNNSNKLCYVSYSELAGYLKSYLGLS